MQPADGWGAGHPPVHRPGELHRAATAGARSRRSACCVRTTSRSATPWRPTADARWSGRATGW